MIATYPRCQLLNFRCSPSRSQGCASEKLKILSAFKHLGHFRAGKETANARFSLSESQREQHKRFTTCIYKMYYTIMEFEWNPAKSESNLRKHGISLDEAKEIFLGPVFTALDQRKDYGESRFISIGALSGIVFLVVAHTDRKGKIRSNYSASAATVTLAPIKGRLCGAKRGGNNNCSAKIRHPRSGDGKKEYPNEMAVIHRDRMQTILKSAEQLRFE